MIQYSTWLVWMACALPLGCLANGSFPDRPITVISPFPAGGGADVVGRILAPRLAAKLGQPVVMDNKPGASGNLGTEFVARSKPDGSTLLIHNNTLTISAALGVAHSLNIQKSLRPIAAVASTPIVIAVNQSLPVKTLAELAEYSRKQGDKLGFSSCGTGTAPHFAGIRFNQLAKSNMVHVPYKGCSQAVLDGLSGQVPVLFSTMPNIDAQVKAGKLRYIAVASSKRLPFMPNLPTISESVGFEGFEAEVWYGFIAPAGLPDAVAQRLEKEIIASMSDKEVQNSFTEKLISIRVLNSKQFEKQISSDLEDWKLLANKFNIKLD
nr:tripartite tricarboxylate transporter substrate binding protein [uncultured Cupriavidus sp.]